MKKNILAVAILLLLVAACSRKTEQPPAQAESPVPVVAADSAAMPPVEQTVAPEPTTSNKPEHKPIVHEPGEITYLNSTTFDVFIAKGRSVVDFWAPWCPPCRQMGPIFEGVAGEVTDVKFAKLNTDDHEKLAQRFGITAIPTLIVFQDGKEVKRVEGLQTRESLIKLVK